MELDLMTTEALYNYTIMKKEVPVTVVYCAEFSCLCYYNVTPMAPALSNRLMLYSWKCLLLFEVSEDINIYFFLLKLDALMLI